MPTPPALGLSCSAPSAVSSAFRQGSPSAKWSAGSAAWPARPPRCPAWPDPRRIRDGCPSVQNAALERHRHCLRAIAHAELGEDAAHEPLGRPAGDLQLLRDLEVGAPLGHQPQHLDPAPPPPPPPPPPPYATRHLPRHL